MRRTPTSAQASATAIIGAVALLVDDDGGTTTDPADEPRGIAELVVLDSVQPADNADTANSSPEFVAEGHLKMPEDYLTGGRTFWIANRPRDSAKPALHDGVGGRAVPDRGESAHLVLLRRVPG